MHAFCRWKSNFQVIFTVGGDGELVTLWAKKSIRMYNCTQQKRFFYCILFLSFSLSLSLSLSLSQLLGDSVSSNSNSHTIKPAFDILCASSTAALSLSLSIIAVTCLSTQRSVHHQNWNLATPGQPPSLFFSCFARSASSSLN